MRGPDAFEERLRAFVLERSEEARAVRVGEKETSEQAAIVARYADLFTRPQLEALREAEERAAGADAAERLHRLRQTCEAGIVVAALAPLQDELQNAELAARVELDGERLPWRAATARLAVLPSYEERERLGAAAMAVSAALNPKRAELLLAAEELRAELSGEPDPVARAEGEKQVSLRRLAEALAAVADATADEYRELRERWLDRLLGEDRPAQPSSYQAPYVHRLSPLAAVYTKERATEVCLATLGELGLDLAGSGVRLDLEDRPQKAPRPAVLAPDPPRVVHLVTRPVGGLQDYKGFLHEAGHALHFAGCDPSLPYAFRRLSRDNALTEAYAFTLQSLLRVPGWHARHLGLDGEAAARSAEAIRFLDAFMFRRYAAKLQFELDFWSRLAARGPSPQGYAERLTAATGFAYPPERYLEDMDAGFYSADYARAWIRSAQLRLHLRGELGAGWWRDTRAAGFLRPLFREGTRPSSEELAGRLGFDPLDTAPLAAYLAGG